MSDNEENIRMNKSNDKDIDDHYQENEKEIHNQSEYQQVNNETVENSGIKNERDTVIIGNSENKKEDEVVLNNNFSKDKEEDSIKKIKEEQVQEQSNNLEDSINDINNIANQNLLNINSISTDSHKDKRSEDSLNNPFLKEEDEELYNSSSFINQLQANKDKIKENNKKQNKTNPFLKEEDQSTILYENNKINPNESMQLSQTSHKGNQTKKINSYFKKKEQHSNNNSNSHSHSHSHNSQSNIFIEENCSLTNEDKDDYIEKSLSELINDFQAFLAKDFIKLFKSNDEVFYLTCYGAVWIIIILIELISGLILSNGEVISDSFFNLFKSMTFFISIFPILVKKSPNILPKYLDNYFNKSRIELICALSNCVLLVIIAMYMTLNALHMITEDDKELHHNVNHLIEESQLLRFNSNFLIIKIVIDVFFLLTFSEYIIHPSFSIKLALRKHLNSWKSFSEVEFKQLKVCNKEIKKCTSHFENMNSLCVCIISDGASSVLLYMLLFIFNGYYESAYTIVCFFNLIIITILITPLFYSLINLFMHGRSSVYQKLYEEVHGYVLCVNEVTRIKEEKWWMITQIDLNLSLKIIIKEEIKEDIDDIEIKDESIGNEDLDKKNDYFSFNEDKIKADIYNLGKEIGVNISTVLDVCYS